MSLDYEDIISNGGFHEKRALMQRLSESGNTENAEIVARLLKDSDEKVVAFAAFHLGQLNARQYLNEIVALLNTDSSAIKNMGASGLSQMVGIDDENLLPVIYPLLSDRDKLVRLSAIEVIGNIASKSSLPYLHEIMAEGSSAEKIRVVQALGMIKDESSLPSLEAYLVEVNTMDFSQRDMGGVRGAPPHPTALKTALETAISEIKTG